MDVKNQRLLDKLETELGPQIVEALRDDLVSDVYLNDDGRVWVHRSGQAKQVLTQMSACAADNLIRSVASIAGKTVTDECPVVEAKLPHGERFIGDTTPISECPTFCIRKPARVVYPLASYLENAMMSQAQYDAIASAVEERKNILVVGGTGSGKTTLTNAILHEIAQRTPEDRILIFEDISELQCDAEDCSFKLTTSTVTMRDLLRNGLRQMPDRIVVGEVRGKEAAVVLQAWNTGHEGGVLTLHANSAREGVDKFVEYVEEGLPGTDKRDPISKAVDLVLYMPKRKKGDKPHLKEAIWLRGMHQDEYVFTNI